MPKQMIGRTAERAQLRAALDAARAGRGGLVMIIGEPGIGKSTLLDAVADDAAAAGLSVLSGRAVEGSGAYRALAEALLPLARAGSLPARDDLRPYRAALGRLLPDWATMRAARSAPETSVDPVLVLGEGLLRLLMAVNPDGTVLLLEDVHWADAETLALLQYLGGALTAAPVLIIATARGRPGSPAVESLINSAGTLIPLPRLEPAEVEEMVKQRGRVLDADALALIGQRAEGLPLLVDELLAGAPADGASGGDLWAVPVSFAAIVDHRLAALDESARTVLAAAASLGAQPDWDLVPAIAGLEGSEAVRSLREAVRVELLITDGAGLGWRHALTRDAVWTRLLPPERAELSRRAARVLRDRGGPGQELAAASLLIEAGDVDEAAAILLPLAEGDLAVGDLRRAESILDQVAATGLTPTRLTGARVDLLALSGRVEQALEVGAAALDDATGEEHAELCFRLARAAILLRRWDDADAYIARARRPEDPRSMILLADSAHGAGRVEEAAGLAARAVELAAGRSDAEVSCEALIVYARIQRLLDADRALGSFRRAAELAAEHGLKPWRVEALLGCGTVELLLHERSPALLEARELATDLGLLVKAMSAQLLLADHLLVTEGPVAAREVATVIIERARLLHLPVFAITAELFEGTARAVAGERTLIAALDQIPESELVPEFLLHVDTLRAMVSAVDHDLAAAAAHLDHGVEPLLAHASVPPLHPFGFWVLMRAVVADRAAEAMAQLRRSPVSMRRANRGALAYAEAVDAGRRGDREEAARAYTVADELLAPIPWWHRFMRVFTLECAVTDGWGDPVPVLRADLTVFEASGEERLARLARNALRRAGAPTRRGRGDSVVPPALRALGVTSRELDVLSAVSAGRSNAEVADQLFLSIRTVETHVANLLAKSGAANRTKLRDWYTRQTP